MIGFRSNQLRYKCDLQGCAIETAPDLGWMFPSFPRGIRPTDVDAMVEIGGRILFFEWKGPQVGIPVGQLRAFRVLAATGHTVLVIRGRIDSEFLEWLRFSPTGKPSGFEATTRTEIAAWLKEWADWADGQVSA